jgi:hypothetical protein
MLLTVDDRELPIAIPSAPENMWFSDRLPTFRNGFVMQDITFHQSIVLVEFITDDLEGYVDWYISEETDVKADESIRLKANRPQQPY